MILFKDKCTNNNIIVKALDTIQEKRIDLNPYTYIYALKYIHSCITTFPSTHAYYHTLHTKFSKSILTQLLQELYNHPVFIKDTRLMNEYIDIFYSINRDACELLFSNKRKKKIEIPKTIYDNKQNVHTKTISDSVLNAASYLYSNYKCSNNEVIPWKDMFQLSYHDATRLFQSLDQKFVFDNERPYTLHDILNCIFKYAYFHLSKDIFFERMYDELKDIYDTKCCTTGKLSRLINSIQGLNENPNVTIQMSERERCFSIIQSYLNNALKNAPENIQDEILDKSDKYKTYIQSLIYNKEKEWIQIHGISFKKMIKECLNLYYL